jgi:hypothetical protein
MKAPIAGGCRSGQNPFLDRQKANIIGGSVIGADRL